jgi:DNA gyrase subunit B
MYMGATDVRGVHHLFGHICDNAVDEVLAGACDRIEVALHKDGSLSVQDNGPGFDTTICADSGLPLLEDVFTVMRAGVPDRKSERYHVSGGLHGISLFAVSALSEWVKVRTRN